MQDAEAIKDEFLAPSVAAVAPVVQRNLPVTYEREQTSSTITGVKPEYLTVRNYALTEGEVHHPGTTAGAGIGGFIGPAGGG